MCIELALVCVYLRWRKSFTEFPLGAGGHQETWVQVLTLPSLGA